MGLWMPGLKFTRLKGIPFYFKLSKDIFLRLKAYWTGAGPNVMRNAIINAAELATYDDAKERVIKHKLMNDNIWCHFLCSAWAGFVATVVVSPLIFFFWKSF